MIVQSQIGNMLGRFKSMNVPHAFKILTCLKLENKRWDIRQLTYNEKMHEDCRKSLELAKECGCIGNTTVCVETLIHRVGRTMSGGLSFGRAPKIENYLCSFQFIEDGMNLSWGYEAFEHHEFIHMPQGINCWRGNSCADVDGSGYFIPLTKVITLDKLSLIESQ